MVKQAKQPPQPRKKPGIAKGTRTLGVKKQQKHSKKTKNIKKKPIMKDSNN